jgi:hypothetical protein
MSRYYRNYPQYLGAQKCCDLRTQGPQGPPGPTGQSAIGQMGPTGPRGLSVTGPTGRSCKGDTGPPGPTGALSNIPGANYRDLISFAFTSNSGVAGVQSPTSYNTPFLVFSQPNTVSLAYISITVTNTSGAQDISFNQIYISDLSGNNYTTFDPSVSYLWTNGETNLIPSSSQNIPKAFSYALSSVITPTSQPRPLGLYISSSSNAISIFSINIGYA